MTSNSSSSQYKFPRKWSRRKVYIVASRVAQENSRIKATGNASSCTTRVKKQYTGMPHESGTQRILIASWTIPKKTEKQIAENVYFSTARENQKFRQFSSWARQNRSIFIGPWQQPITYWSSSLYTFPHDAGKWSRRMVQIAVCRVARESFIIAIVRRRKYTINNS